MTYPKTKAEAQQKIVVVEGRGVSWRALAAQRTPPAGFSKAECERLATACDSETTRLRALLPTLPE